MKRLLIVEDDAENNQMIREYLESHGYACTQAYSGSEGKLLFSLEKFDLVLLDLMLPGVPGEELVGVFSGKAPVIVLSARDGLDSKVKVLSDGADDYICKPFDLPELLVRIQVQLRRQDRIAETTDGERSAERGHSTEREHSMEGEHSMEEKRSSEDMEEPEGQVYRYREWTLNPDTQEMTAAGQPVTLTRHEFLILELFIRNPKRVFSKQMIYEYAWGEEYLAEDKTINVHISNIRGKLKESGTDTYIQTVWGLGFKLN